MNFKVRAFSITVGICLVIQLLLVSLSGAVAFFSTGSTGDITNPQSIGQVVSVGSLVCLCLFGMDILAGALYAFLGSRQPPFSAPAGALGGAAASAGVRLVSASCSTCFTIVLLPLLKENMEQLPATTKFPDVLVYLIVILGYGALAALLGAVSGIIVAAIAAQKPAPPAV